MTVDAYAEARRQIDAAHAADPNHDADGTPAELRYADRIESWVKKLVPEATPILLLAARCQHLERWKTPRNTYPEGRAGYLAWRRSLYTLQANRARELMLQAGIAADLADEARLWVSKSGLKINAGTQALEDAAILVFLENEIGTFATEHADYPREKFINILQKSWRKLSPQGQQAAQGLDLPAPIAALLAQALGNG